MSSSKNDIADTTLDSLEIQLKNGVSSTIQGTKNIVRRVSQSSEDLKNYLLTFYPNGFSLENILDVVITSIQYLSRIRKMSGQQKKQTIIDATLLLLDETNRGEMEYYEPILKSMIPSTINTLIDVEKKKIKLNKRAKRCLTCGCC